MSLRGGSGVLALLVLSITINYLDRGALSVAAPLVATELQLSTTEMGFLLSAFFWTYATFQLVTGWLVDRFSVKWVYAGGFLLWSLATAAMGLAYSLPALVAARFVLGAGESVAFPACSRFIVEAFPEARRGMANALVDAGAKAGPGLSTLVGGLAVAAFGWRGLFVAIGLGSLLWLIPWLVAAPGGQGEAGGGAASPSWGQLLRTRAVWITSLGMFTYGYVNYFMLTWLPSYLVRERGFSMTDMAVFGSIPFWMMAVGSLAAGWTTDRLIRAGRPASAVRKYCVALGLFLCGAAMLPAPMVSSATHSLLLITFSSVFLGVFSSNVWAITQTFAGPAAAGRWTGFQNFIGNLGGVAAPMATGWIVAETGSFQLAFWLAAAVQCAGVVLYLVFLGKVETVEW